MLKASDSLKKKVDHSIDGYGIAKKTIPRTEKKEEAP